MHHPVTLEDDLPRKKMSDGWRLGGRAEGHSRDIPSGKAGDSGFKGNCSSSSLGVQPRLVRTRLRSNKRDPQTLVLRNHNHSGPVGGDKDVLLDASMKKTSRDEVCSV